LSQKSDADERSSFCSPRYFPLPVEKTG